MLSLMVLFAPQCFSPPYFLLLPCSLLPPLDLPCSPVPSSLHWGLQCPTHTWSDPFCNISSKAAVVSPAIFCSSYNTQPTLCFPALPASSPWICHGVTNFLAPPWSLVAAGWLVTLQRIHIQSLTCHPAGCHTDVMPIFINPLVRKPCKLVGNYLCSAWHPWKTRKHVHVTLPLGISLWQWGMKGFSTKRSISKYTRNKGR